jgi:hypothetical protein
MYEAFYLKFGGHAHMSLSDLCPDIPINTFIPVELLESNKGLGEFCFTNEAR